MHYILFYIKLGRSHLNILIEKIYIDYIFVFQMIIKKKFSVRNTYYINVLQIFYEVLIKVKIIIYLYACLMYRPMNVLGQIIIKNKIGLNSKVDPTMFTLYKRKDHVVALFTRKSEFKV